MKAYLIFLFVILITSSCHKKDLVIYQVTTKYPLHSIIYKDETGTNKAAINQNSTNWSYVFEAEKKDSVYIEVSSQAQNDNIKIQIYFKNKLLKVSENSGGQLTLAVGGII